MSAAEAKSQKRRRRSGAAAWHMSMQAVDMAVMDVGQWTDRQCFDFLVQVRFGSWETVSCPHCGTVDEHYWRKTEKRWKCKGCGSTFSITSGTVFSNRKKPLKHIVASVLTWVNSAAGQPALELKRHMKTTYNTVFTLQHKLREALIRGYNVGLLNGDVEMDGAHQSGHRAAEKRGKPQISQSIENNADIKELTATMLTQTGRGKQRQKAKESNVIDPAFGTTMPENRRILFAIRKRSEVPGKGACATRVAIGLVENPTVAEAVVKDYVAIPESYLNTDTHPAYKGLGQRFKLHRTVNHARTLSGAAGENNNQAEELNARFDRAEKGIYLNIEPKYMLDYAVETAFRSDTRRLPNGQQLKLALHIAMNVGESRYWKGFTKGAHRSVELTHPNVLPAPASGPAKGARSTSSANGRPPR